MRILFCIVALLVSVLGTGPAGAMSQDASNRCLAGGAGRNFDGLLLCVPADNERYRLIEDGTDWVAWQGDTPIPRPTKDRPASGDPLELTLSRAWIGEAVVGAADSASGERGFDHFMGLIAASILQHARDTEAATDFTADVPVDESGVLQRFEFSYLDDDLVLGKRVEQAAGPDVILYRPSTGAERPHVMLCGGNGGGESATHVCMSMRDMAGHRIGIMVTGTELPRSFRFVEQVGADLESFVVPAP